MSKPQSTFEARIQELESLVIDFSEKREDVYKLMKATGEENTALRTALEAEGLLTKFNELHPPQPPIVDEARMTSRIWRLSMAKIPQRTSVPDAQATVEEMHP